MSGIDSLNLQTQFLSYKGLRHREDLVDVLESFRQAVSCCADPAEANMRYHLAF